MATSRSDREFISGATVVLTVIVSQPDSGAPLDPTQVTLDLLKVGADHLVTVNPVTFTKVTPGQYVLRVDSTGFIPGTYTWRAKAQDALLGVGLREDTFVVRAPS